MNNVRMHMGTTVPSPPSFRLDKPVFVASPLSPNVTRDSIYAIAHICHGNSVCPSICLSITHVIGIKTAEHVIEILSLPDWLITLVFCHRELLHESMVSPLTGH